MKISRSKARTLDWLTGKPVQFSIPEFIYFSVDQWLKEKDLLINTAIDKFPNTMLAIRSSAADEDGLNLSRAGEYESVLSVPSDDPAAINTAIEKVINSYEKNNYRNDINEIILQKMLNNIIMSGVVFTHDLNTGAPYYVINYDDVSGLTHTVTSGEGEYANRTLYIHRGATNKVRSERFRILLQAIQELEEITDSQFLDIEFALGHDMKPYLLQVRNITNQPNWNRAISKRIDKTLDGIQSFTRSSFQKKDGIYGKTTIFGQMPDWNPAEMIGRAPRALAFSLYKTLITDHAWRIAREKMGYATPAGQPLMVSLAGQPFIDVRLSFHSYIPKDLSPDISEKLVNAWVERLSSHPELHDKIEFDVAITAYSFDIDEKIESLMCGVLSEDEKLEYKKSIYNQTLQIFRDDAEGSLDRALKRINILSGKQAEIYTGSFNDHLSTLLRMIDECINYGTIPFSILARHNFIARTLLLSLCQRNILTMDDIYMFQSGIRTIAYELVDDMYKLQRGEVEKKYFMERYGHLRPGTYDILSLRYDQMDDIVSDKLPDHETRNQSKFAISKKQRNKINQLLTEEKFPWVDADGFFNYIRDATAGREYGKFVFTKSVSDILEVIAQYGENYGLSRDEMSHIPIDKILNVATNSFEGSLEDRMRKIAEEGAEKHILSSAIRLPQVLYDEAGVHVIPFQVSHPNFITNKKVTSACLQIFTGRKPPDLSGKIILIENADPGFDWIFAHPIKGLITKYGGVNSHMAIRCAEFGIPAAIGCGEQRFEILTKADHIMLDCSASVIQTL